MFIEISGRILDLEKYNEEVRLLKKILRTDAKELFEKFGFEQKDERFCNKSLDLEILFRIRKKGKMKIA